MSLVKAFDRVPAPSDKGRDVSCGGCDSLEDGDDGAEGGGETGGDVVEHVGETLVDEVGDLLCLLDVVFEAGDDRLGEVDAVAPPAGVEGHVGRGGDPDALLARGRGRVGGLGHLVLLVLLFAKEGDPAGPLPHLGELRVRVGTEGEVVELRHCAGRARARARASGGRLGLVFAQIVPLVLAACANGAE